MDSTLSKTVRQGVWDTMWPEIIDPLKEIVGNSTQYHVLIKVSDAGTRQIRAIKNEVERALVSDPFGVRYIYMNPTW